MAYTPTIIIRKSDLQKHEQILEAETYSGNFEEEKVAEFLLYILLESQTISFPEIDLLLCEPEFSTFNKQVRDKLTALDVEFKTFD